MTELCRLQTILKVRRAILKGFYQASCGVARLKNQEELETKLIKIEDLLYKKLKSLSEGRIIMSTIDWITLVLVLVTAIYVWLVFSQTKRLKELTLKQIRYQVEGDITQLRIKRAEFLKGGDTRGEGKSEAMKIIDYRECQCTKTVNRIEAELQSSSLKREIERFMAKVQNRRKRNG